MSLESYFKLISKSQEQVRWGVNQFPDGQIQFWIEEADAADVTGLISSLPTPAHTDLLAQMVSVLPPLETARIAYLYGARSDKDRAGSRLVANVAKLTIERFGGIARNLQLVSPHCEPLLTHLESATLVKPLHDEIGKNLNEYGVWLFPDESAIKRFGHLAPASVKTLVCSKERDQVTGNIINHGIPDLSGISRLLVMDDLCDGGRSFIDVAHAVGSMERLDLYVTHGVFSNNAPARLFEAGFNNIYVTNSLPDVQEKHADLHVLDVWRLEEE